MSTHPLHQSGGLPDPAELAQLASEFFATLPNGERDPNQAVPVPTAPAALQSRGPQHEIGQFAGLHPAPATVPTTPPATPRAGLADNAPNGYAAALPVIDKVKQHSPSPTNPFYFLGDVSGYPAGNNAGTSLPGLQPFGTPTDHDLRDLLDTEEPALRSGGIPSAHSSGLADHAGSFYFLDTVRFPGPQGSHAGAVPNLASSARPPFDVNAVRRDFPILQERVNGKQLVWFDNAATTQKPQAVMDRLTYFYAHENSNIHRAAHELAARATDAYEGAREKVRAFINAPDVNEVIFVRGTTEAINLVAKSWGGQHVSEGDEIIVSHLEHHANIVPWQQLASAKGAKLRVIPVDDSGQVLLDEYAKLLNDRTKIVSITQVSNALGTVVPVKQIVEMAHRAGAIALVDGAQSVSHMQVDVQDIGADFFVFSGHKVFGPTGIGALWGKRAVLEDMPPWQGGGNVIADVTFEKTVFQPIPNKFEAGTGNIADAVGLGAAIDYVNKIGIENIARYEHDLLVYGMQQLREIKGVRLIGTAADKASVMSFVLAGYSTEEVGHALNEEGIAVRTGHHCAQPILRRFGVETTVRPSLAFYNTFDEIDRLATVVRRLSGQRRVA